MTKPQHESEIRVKLKWNREKKKKHSNILSQYAICLLTILERKNVKKHPEDSDNNSKSGCINLRGWGQWNISWIALAFVLQIMFQLGIDSWQLCSLIGNLVASFGRKMFFFTGLVSALSFFFSLLRANTAIVTF